MFEADGFQAFSYRGHLIDGPSKWSEFLEELLKIRLVWFCLTNIICKNIIYLFKIFDG